MRSVVRIAAVLAALGFFAGTAAADTPKSYDISIRTVTMMGSHQLEPGQYSLLLHGHDSKVVMQDRDGNEIPVEAKLETGNEKFGQTAVLVNTAGGTRKITEIRLGGSKTRLAFD